MKETLEADAGIYPGAWLIWIGRRCFYNAFIEPRTEKRSQNYAESVVQQLVAPAGVFSYEALADAECYDEEKRNHRSVRF